MKKSKQDHFLTLYQPVHAKFERFCRARVYGNMDYEDLMHETLLVAFQKIDTLKSEKAFFSFLVGISVRILSNHHKKRKEDLTGQPEQFDAVDANADTERDAEVFLLHKALSMLPETQREAIVLFEISGFPIKEIALMQDASESAVKQRLKRGREELTRILTFESDFKNKEVKNGTHE